VTKGAKNIKQRDGERQREVNGNRELERERERQREMNGNRE
jgi:hypothetical protein